MSGLEVIGVVLGLYPLVVNAYQAYKKDNQSDNGIEALIRKLKTQEIIYKEFVDHLLGPNVSEAELLRLKTTTDSQNHNGWRDSALQANLKERLGFEKAHHITKIVDDIGQLLESMRKDLPGVGRQFERQRPTILRTIRNPRLSRLQSSLKSQFDQLTEYNQELRQLLGDMTLPSSRGPWAKKPLPSIEFPRRDCSDAKHIYSAMYNAYRCNCDNPHLANLKLPQITGPGNKRDETHTYNERHLEVFFSIQNTLSAKAADLAIEMLDEVERGAKVNEEPAPLQVPGDYVEAQANSRTSVGDNLTEPAERFKLTERKSHPISICECLEDRRDAIQDLCMFVKSVCDSNNIEPQDTKEGIGILRSEEKKYKLETPSHGKELHASHGTVSLEELTSPQSTLSRQDRMSLALRLSYAILQYYSTGWIDTGWTWKDFSVAKTEDQKPDESHLFVTQKFYSASSKSSALTASSSTLTAEIWACIGEPILTRLGFALIELALGKRLAELRDANAVNMDPDMLDFFTARHLLKTGRIIREEGKAYHDVVRACLEHQFEHNSEVKSLDSRNTSFHEDVEQCVIGPLHCIYTESWGRE